MQGSNRAFTYPQMGSDQHPTLPSQALGLHHHTFRKSGTQTATVKALFLQRLTVEAGPSEDVDTQVRDFQEAQRTALIGKIRALEFGRILAVGKVELDMNPARLA